MTKRSTLGESVKSFWLGTNLKRNITVHSKSFLGHHAFRRYSYFSRNSLTNIIEMAVKTIRLNVKAKPASPQLATRFFFHFTFAPRTDIIFRLNPDVTRESHTRVYFRIRSARRYDFHCNAKLALKNSTLAIDVTPSSENVPVVRISCQLPWSRRSVLCTASRI